MLTALLLSSLTLAPAEAPAIAQQAEPPVRVWLSKRGDVERGDRVRVYVETDTDGYLVVLHAEPDGRIRVLFPLDPYDDNFIRGRTEYEIEGRGGREAFRVYEEAGVGTVYVAFARDPFQAEPFVREDHWDYRIFETWRITEDLDAEAELTALVQQMAAGRHFDYDLMPYYVGQRWAGDYQVHHYYTGQPVYFGVSMRWGGWYPWSYRIHAYSTSWVCSDPFWWDSWRCDPWYYSGWSYYDPWYYDPWRGPWGHRYAYSYDPYYYGYHGYRYYGYGYRTVYVSHPTRYAYSNQRLVIGRYTFKPLNRSGFGDGGITARRRFAASAGGTRPVLASGERRGVPQMLAATPRRTAATNTPAVSAGRRVAPSTVTATSARRTIGATATPDGTAGRRVTTTTTPAASGARRVTPTQPSDGRRVQPAGWGMTDGRRTVTTPARPATDPKVTEPGRRTPTQPVTPPTAGQREQPAQPATTGTPTRRPTTSGTPATTTRKPAVESPAAPARRPTTTPTTPPSSTSSTTRRPASEPAASGTARRSTVVPRTPATSSRSAPASQPSTSSSARRPVAVPAPRPSTSSSSRQPTASPAPRPSTSSSTRRPTSSPAPRPSTSSSTRRPTAAPAPRPSTSSSTRRPTSSPAPRPSASSGSSRQSSSPPARSSGSSSSTRTRRPD